MLAYAPRPASRAGSPRTLMLVAAGHVVALGLVLTARSEYVARQKDAPPTVVFIDPPKPPPPPPPSDPRPNPERDPIASTLDKPVVIVPIPPTPADPVADGPPTNTVGPIAGPVLDPIPPYVPPPPRLAIERKAARFITPPDQVRPPYPAAKQRLQEEASLRLSLAIDARGRVTSVTSVGVADPAFLDAARRHILRHWRYQPALDGGEAVASTTVITLRFNLEE